MPKKLEHPLDRKVCLNISITMREHIKITETSAKNGQTITDYVMHAIDQTYNSDAPESQNDTA